MEQRVDEAGDSDASPREALKRARNALQRLENDQVSERRLTLGTRFAVVAVTLLSWAGLLVHTFFEKEAPKVDTTTVALLAVALIAPFVSRLKALEVGGAKAEWREEAEVGLKEMLQLAGMQQAALERLFDEVARAASSSEADQGLSPTQTTSGPTDVLAQPIRRILWVDDHPERNTYEIESLKGILEVVTATTNEEVFNKLESRDFDVLISDVGRDYDRSGESPAGVKLLRDLRKRYPNKHLPVVYYTSTGTIDQYGKELLQQGAAGVTSLFSDLMRALRQIDQQNLETLASNLAMRHGQVHVLAGAFRLDVVVELPNGKLLGIEVASWLQRPQMAAFAERVSHLTQALERGAVSRGLLLVRPEVLDDRRREWAQQNRVELVAPSDLEKVLVDG